MIIIGLLNLILILAPISIFAQSMSLNIDPDKFTVCAVTINSDDEKKLWQKEVAKFPQKFNPVIELTSIGQGNWLENSCKAGIRCDQLLISGHFAGSFFGDKGIENLTLETMYKNSCNPECQGIFNSPYEVFLLGCNTLATKEPDHRTPEQYFEVLIQDGISPSAARAGVEARYGDFGESFKAQMQRIFRGQEKKLYGFSSVGPLGKNIKPFLENYFKTNPLDTHLEKISTQRAMNQVISVNSKLAQSLKSTAFTECGGGTEDELSSKICDLSKDSTPNDIKLTIIEDLFARDLYLKYFPDISNALNSMNYNMSSDAQAKLEQLKSNPVIKSQLLALQNKDIDLQTKIHILNVNEKFGHITQSEKHDHIAKNLISAFDKPLKEYQVDSLCEISSKIPKAVTASIKFEDLKNKKINVNEVFAYQCLSLYQNGFPERVHSTISTNSSIEMKVEVVSYLSRAADEQYLDFQVSTHVKNAISNFLKSNKNHLKELALEATAHLTTPDQVSIQFAQNLLDHNDFYNRKLSLQVLEKAKITTPKVINVAKEMAKDGYRDESILIILHRAKDPSASEYIQQFLQFGGVKTKRLISHLCQSETIPVKFQEGILNQIKNNPNYIKDEEFIKKIKLEKFNTEVKSEIEKILK